MSTSGGVGGERSRDRPLSRFLEDPSLALDTILLVQPQQVHRAPSNGGQTNGSAVVYRKVFRPLLLAWIEQRHKGSANSLEKR